MNVHQDIVLDCTPLRRVMTKYAAGGRLSKYRDEIHSHQAFAFPKVQLRLRPSVRRVVLTGIITSGQHRSPLATERLQYYVRVVVPFMALYGRLRHLPSDGRKYQEHQPR